MIENNDFDKGIREKLEGKRFEFNEANWNKMLSQIELDEAVLPGKKKKRFFLYLIFTLSAFVGLSSLWIWNGGQKKQNTHGAGHKTENISLHGNHPGKRENVIQPQKKEQGLTVENKVMNDTEEKVKSENENADIVAEGNRKAGAIVKSGIVKKSSGRIENHKDPAAEIAMINNSMISHSKGKTKMDRKADKQQKQVLSGNEIDRQGAIQTDQTQTKKNEEVKTMTGAENATAKVDSLPEVGKSVSLVSGGMPDESVNQAPIDSPEIITENKKQSSVQSPLMLSFDAGAYYMPGFHPGKTKEGRSFNPAAGILVCKIFPNGFSLGAGVYYSFINNVSEKGKILRDTLYDFGYTSGFTEIITQKIHFLELPLYAGYYNRKNIFLAGISIGYHLTSVSKVNTYAESYGIRQDYFPEPQGKELSRKVYGYMDGFTSWDFSAQLMYRREISKRIGAGVSVRYGLMDVKRNTYFLNTEFDRNMGLSLLVSYKILN